MFSVRNRIDLEFDSFSDEIGSKGFANRILTIESFLNDFRQKIKIIDIFK